jgi:Flp pilus assembly protein TadG
VEYQDPIGLHHQKITLLKSESVKAVNPFNRGIARGTQAMLRTENDWQFGACCGIYSTRCLIDGRPGRGLVGQASEPRGDCAMGYRFIDLARQRSGSAVIEFALLAPVLILLMLGTFQFGLVLINYLTLTNATQTAARQFAISRGSTTTAAAAATSTLTGAAANLVPGNLTITFAVNGANCTDASTTTCSSALSAPANLGQAATVTATYPCSLMVYGHDYGPSCTLTSTITERIE